jgi:prepilin-type N-terminal cleavage/methylation domain-containing protein
MSKGIHSTGSLGRPYFFSRAIHEPLNASRHGGFSLVELLMTVVLLAIGAAVALPSYRDQVEKRQVTNAAEQVVSFINSAQGVAMKTNRVVSVSYAREDADDWCIGAVVGETACLCSQTDPDEADYCQIGSQPYVINASHAGGLNVMHSVTGDGAYAFDPVRGLFLDLDDSLAMELRSESGDFRLNVQVNNSGRVIICSADSGHAIPGYGVCGGGVVDFIPGPVPEPEPLPGPEPLPEPDPLPGI